MLVRCTRTNAWEDPVLIEMARIVQAADIKGQWAIVGSFRLAVDQRDFPLVTENDRDGRTRRFCTMLLRQLEGRSELRNSRRNNETCIRRKAMAKILVEVPDWR